MTGATNLLTGSEGSGGEATNLNLSVHDGRAGHIGSLARAEGCVDRLVDGAGGRPCGEGRRTRGQAGPAAEDAGQFEPSAIEGTEAVGAGRAQGEGQPACGGASPASSRSDIEARIPGLALPRLRRRCFGRRAEPLRELRPRRNPRDRARRDAGDAARRRLPVLRQALQGGAAARPGTGIAVRTEPARVRDVSALGPGHPAGAVERRAERPVRPRHQRRRVGQYSGRQPRALRGADEPDQGAASSRHSARLRRNRHEVGKANWWLWVFHHGDSAVFVADAHRSKAVVEAFLGEWRPDYWISDRLASQRGWAKREHQVCLAHLIRDVQYAIDAGDAVFAPGMKGLLKRACAIGRRRDALAESTLKTYEADLNRRLDRLIRLNPTAKAGRQIQIIIRKVRRHLFVFVTNRDLEATNNGSERALRPSAVYRKITNGFRSEWAAKLYADIRSVVETARRRSIRAIDAIRLTLQAKPIPRPA